MNPERELAEVQAGIDRLTAELEPLRERADRLRSILAGPRVVAVVVTVSHGSWSWDGYNDLGEACLMFEHLGEDGLCSPQRVMVGGAVLTEEERAGRAEEYRRSR